MTTPKISVLLAAIGSMLALQAQDEAGKFSLRTDLGVSIIEDNEAGPFEQSFEPGLRFDLVPTYHITPNVGLEFNTGVIWNGYDELEGPGGSISVDGDALIIPLLVGATFRFPMEIGLTPFIGAGGGGVWAYSTIDEAGGTPVDDSEDDFYGALQAVGGVEYQLNDNLALGLVYKYLRIFSSEDESIPGVGTVESDDIAAHAISLSLRMSY